MRTPPGQGPSSAPPVRHRRGCDSDHTAHATIEARWSTRAQLRSLTRRLAQLRRAVVRPHGPVPAPVPGYRQEVTAPSTVELRRCVLAVSVLYDLDVVASPDGAVVAGQPPVQLPWAECHQALAGASPESALGRDRLARWVGQRRWLADRSLGDLAERPRPVGVPVDSELPPGANWVRQRVLGGALDLGIGFVGLDPSRPDDVEVVGPELLATAEVPAAGWWPAARHYLDRMGAMAAARFIRDPKAPLRPMGDCDVVTLLGSTAFRTALCANSQGMCPVAVPMRSRGWLDLSHIDPAFAIAAAAATDPSTRGFVRPLLATDSTTRRAMLCAVSPAAASTSARLPCARNSGGMPKSRTGVSTSWSRSS